MIPLLYDENSIGTNGISLFDTIRCTVTEELNGIFELSMEYPKDGDYANNLAIRKIISAIPSPYREQQYFRIYEIKKSISGNIQVNARHIVYDLCHAMTLGGHTNADPYTAFFVLKSNSYPQDDTWYDPVMQRIEPINHIAKQFTLSSNIETTKYYIWDSPVSIKNILGGIDNSILDLWHGEYLYDNYHITYNSRRGIDRDFTVRYGFNMTACDFTVSDDKQVTGVIAFWKKEVDGQKVIVIPRDGQNIPKIIYMTGTTSNDYIESLDVSDKFDTTPTQQQVEDVAREYITANYSKDVETNLEAQFIRLSQTVDYKDLPINEECDLGDSVKIECEPLGIVATARVKKIETDVLLERYNRIEIGTLKTTLTETLRKLIYKY